MFSRLISIIQLKLDDCLIFLGSIHYIPCILYTTSYSILIHVKRIIFQLTNRGHRGRDHMVVEFTTTCAINAYHH
jgi:hypothetical protein